MPQCFLLSFIMHSLLLSLIHIYRLIDELPEIQNRRFRLYYDYDLNDYQIGAMEHCNASAARNSVVIAREKTKRR